MEKIKVEYKFGHLYNQETKKRVLIKDKALLSILIDEEAIMDKDGSVSQNSKPLDSLWKRDEVERYCGVSKPYWKLLNANTFLYFRISRNTITTYKLAQ